MKRITVIAAAFICMAASAQNSDSLSTLSLRQCLDMAADNNAYVKNAQLDVLAAQAQKRETAFLFMPTVAANSFGFHALQPLVKVGVNDILGYSDAANEINYIVEQIAPRLGLPTSYSALQYGYGASLTLQQPIFAGGRIINGNRLAGIGVKAAELQSSLKEKSTASEIEGKYWLAVSLDEKAITLAKARELLDSLYKDASSAYSAGLLTDAEMLQVKLKQSELRSNAIQLKGGRQLARMDLFNAIGLKYDVLSVDDVVFTDRIDSLSGPDSYYVSAEKQASDTEESRLLQLQVEAKDLEKKIAMGEALPQVALGGMYGYGKMLNDGKTNGALYAIVTVPITDWAKTSQKMKRLDYQTQKARNEQDYLDAQLVLRARQRWVSLNTAWEQYQVEKEAVEMAAEEETKMESKFRAGMVPLSDLLGAQMQLRARQDALIDSAIAYKKALGEYLGHCSGE